MFSTEAITVTQTLIELDLNFFETVVKPKTLKASDLINILFECQFVIYDDVQVFYVFNFAYCLVV